MMAQDRIYARALGDYAPNVVAAACDEWARSRQFWPELASLMTLCAEHERLAEFARTPKLPPPCKDTTPVLSDAERLVLWQKSDRMAEDLSTSGAFAEYGFNLRAGFRQRREADHPELAARYYAGEAAE
jgi:hypothetical protein